MTNRRLRAAVALLALAAPGLGAVAGCDVLNPSLVAGVGVNPIAAMDVPDGSILIVVMNDSDSVAVAHLTIEKTNGWVVHLAIPVLPFDANSDEDFAMVVQDCDIASIQYRGSFITALRNFIDEDNSPLVGGRVVNCGNVIAIWITQSGLNYYSNLSVF